MAVDDELERALAYQLREREREQFDAQRRAGLAGDRQAKVEFDARWMPLQAWLDENRNRKG